ncbi:MAG: GTP 3',8-cyclase MoaA [Desulfatibacillaceae bacterium]
MNCSDRFDRKITYLRVSVTDRCNLRCFYCTPVRNYTPLPHDEILSYEEILSVIRAGADLGIRKVRVTGGEPLVRKGVADLISGITNLTAIEDLGLTTNGVLLGSLAPALYEAGLRRVNISLDTLRPDTFHRITGRDLHRHVMAGIDAALATGFNPVKLNVVPVRGLNDTELEDLARLTLDRPLVVRFIEFMPTGGVAGWTPDRFIPWEEMRDRVVKNIGPLSPVANPTDLDGPAMRFRFPEAPGEIGFITSVTRHFCDQCNRMRLTSDGKLRPCLFSDVEVDARQALRPASDPGAVRAAFAEAIRAKPRGQCGESAGHRRLRRGMSGIGG